MNFPITRLTRLRAHPRIRELIQETQLSLKDLILPLFIKEEGSKEPIDLMPGHFQLTLSDLAQEAEEIQNLGIPGIILFGIPTYKDATGASSYQKNNIIAQAIRIIKAAAPDLLVITDVCLCGYTNHGHCGILKPNNQDIPNIDNDATLEILSKQAISHAKAGVDVVAPSGMIDGMVGAIRTGLDNAGFQHVPILSYSVKYASSFYAPFREAAENTPKGPRQSYQMDPSNALEALREVKLDLQEGADMIMVKPAGPYLDVIYRIKKAHPDIPLGAYQVSGEFSMIRAAAMNGWIEESRVVLESLLAMKRAGADFIITYFAKEVAKWIL